MSRRRSSRESGMGTLKRLVMYYLAPPQMVQFPEERVKQARFVLFVTIAEWQLITSTATRIANPCVSPTKLPYNTRSNVAFLLYVLPLPTLHLHRNHPNPHRSTLSLPPLFCRLCTLPVSPSSTHSSHFLCVISIPLNIHLVTH